jgi:hypothetical protein
VALLFQVDQLPPIPIMLGDAERLARSLAGFGTDQEMPRSRQLADRIRDAAIDMATTRVADNVIGIGAEDAENVFAALDRLLNEEGLSEPLRALYADCASQRQFRSSP